MVILRPWTEGYSMAGKELPYYPSIHLVVAGLSLHQYRLPSSMDYGWQALSISQPTPSSLTFLRAFRIVTPAFLH